ncbi:hypothetical protein [Oscillibacter sp.]|uniref:hypothetical protein n=1 Tax=Oscillibacter sp. TaxID=1945593 RepID=UPI0028AF7AE4|nr:hypothetical protein [Oscillibacter sp.]MDD3230713.1 hypothetical protein [Oscillospiraceae bacterium]
MTDTKCKEEYIYQVDKIKFVVTPVYKETGELLRDILLKLMLADLEPVQAIPSASLTKAADRGII